MSIGMVALGDGDGHADNDFTILRAGIGKVCLSPGLGKALLHGCKKGEQYEKQSKEYMWHSMAFFGECQGERYLCHCIQGRNLMAVESCIQFRDLCGKCRTNSL